MYFQISPAKFCVGSFGFHLVYWDQAAGPAAHPALTIDSAGDMGQISMGGARPPRTSFAVNNKRVPDSANKQLGLSMERAPKAIPSCPRTWPIWLFPWSFVGSRKYASKMKISIGCLFIVYQLYYSASINIWNEKI